MLFDKITGQLKAKPVRVKTGTLVDAHKAFDLFIETFEAKYPKATECLMKDRDELLTFFNFPARHWQSIRTSNPIGSAFATIRHRTRRTKGCLSRDGMLNMMFRLGKCAEKSWRKLRGFATRSSFHPSPRGHSGRQFRQRDQTIKHRSGWRMRTAWTPDLTVALSAASVSTIGRPGEE